MIAEIVSGVAAAAIVGAGGWLARAFLVLRPKVRVGFAKGNAQSGPGNALDLMLTWWYSLTLANLSKHDALELELVSVSNNVVDTLPASHITALASVKYEGRLQKLVNREFVVSAAHDFNVRLQPAELRNIGIILRYRNESGLRFYTVYEKHGEIETNIFRFRRPSVDVSAALGGSLTDLEPKGQERERR